jgi:GNAT superfamily N-acetyltransferase
MVTLHSSHPSKLKESTKVKLGNLSFKHNGQLQDYILGDDYSVHDKVFWLERDGKIFAWAVRAYGFYVGDNIFMVYVNRLQRKRGWGKYLYQTAMKHTKKSWLVYGQHAVAAGAFYQKMGYKEEELL